MKLSKGFKKFPKDMKKFNLIKLQNFNLKQLSIHNLTNLKLTMKPKSILIKQKNLINLIYIKQPFNLKQM